MKSHLIITSLLTCFLYPAFGEVTTPQPRISSVMLSPDGAMITESVSMQIPRGNQIVKVPNLNQLVDPSTLQIQVSGIKGLSFLGAQIKKEIQKPESPQELQTLLTQKENLQTELATLQSNVQAIAQQHEYFAALIQGFKTPDKIGPENPEELYQFYQTGIKSLVTESVQNQAKLDKGQKEFKILEEKIQRLSSQEISITQVAEITLQNPEDSAVEIQISYWNPNSSWSPEYRIETQINPQLTEASIKLSLVAAIFQNTGTDWNDVKAELVTKRPSLTSNPGDLPPETVSYIQAQPDMGINMPDQTRHYAAKSEAMIVEEVQELAPAEIPMAVFEDLGINTKFILDSPIQVPSTQEPTLVALSQSKFTGKIERIAKPKLSLEVFLKTEVTNPKDAPSLLPAQASVLLDNTYLGKTQIPQTISGGKFDLWLGTDPSISIRRTKLPSKKDDAWLLQRSNYLKVTFEIEVDNQNKEGKTITIIDQIPVSTNKDIQIKDVSFSTPPSKNEKETGIITWNYQAPTGKSKITFEYTIQWPIDQNITQPN